MLRLGLVGGGETPRVAVFSFARVSHGLREAEAEASYVAGFPVPLPLPPGPSLVLD